MTRILLALLALCLATVPAVALDPFEAAGIDRRPGAQVPMDLQFRDEQGAGVTLRAFAQGKPLLLVPVQHHCPNICGVTLAGLLQAIGSQSLRPGEDFAVVTFGIDPRERPNDAKDALDQLLQEFPGFPRGAIHGLTGTATDIATVTRALGYRYAWDGELGQYDHVAATAVLTPDGRLTHWLYGVAPEPADLKLALTEAGQGRIGSFGDQLLLLCYHYDPATGRYSTAIWTSLQALAAVTLLGLVAWIAAAVYRERRTAGGRPS